ASWKSDFAKGDAGEVASSSSRVASSSSRLTTCACVPMSIEVSAIVTLDSLVSDPISERGATTTLPLLRDFNGGNGGSLFKLLLLLELTLPPSDSFSGISRF